VHELPNDPESRVLVLGCGREQETYLICGTAPAPEDAMAYNKNVVLEQVDHQSPVPEPSSRSREPTKKLPGPTSAESLEEIAPRKRLRNNQIAPRSFPRESTLPSRSESVTHGAAMAYAAGGALKVEDTDAQDKHTPVHSDSMNSSPATGPARVSTRKSLSSTNAFAPPQPQTISDRHGLIVLDGTMPYSNTSRLAQQSAPSIQHLNAALGKSVLPMVLQTFHSQPTTGHEQHDQPAFSRVQQPLAGAQQARRPDLQQGYRVILDHVCNQEDLTTELSVMFSSAKLQKYMKGLEVSAEMVDAYLFRTMRDMIDEELVARGFAKLSAT
jgi:hypothetical protein